MAGLGEVPGSIENEWRYGDRDDEDGLNSGLDRD